MAEMPKIMLRVRPEHQSLVRDLAARLTTDDGFAALLAALLEDPSSAPGRTSVAETAALAARVVTLEAIVAEVRQILITLVEELQGHRHDPLPPRPAFSAVEVPEAPEGRDLCP